MLASYNRFTHQQRALVKGGRQEEQNEKVLISFE